MTELVTSESLPIGSLNQHSGDLGGRSGLNRRTKTAMAKENRRANSQDAMKHALRTPHGSRLGMNNSEKPGIMFSGIPH
jgi:hypothetical protein